eukprot:2137692-Pyramimonas_sp.AAC.2
MQAVSGLAGHPAVTSRHQSQKGRGNIPAPIAEGEGEYRSSRAAADGGRSGTLVHIQLAMAALSPTLAGPMLFQKYREALAAVGGTPEAFLTSDFEVCSYRGAVTGPAAGYILIEGL